MIITNLREEFKDNGLVEGDMVEYCGEICQVVYSNFEDEYPYLLVSLKTGQVEDMYANLNVIRDAHETFFKNKDIEVIIK